MQGSPARIDKEDTPLQFHKSFVVTDYILPVRTGAIHSHALGSRVPEPNSGSRNSHSHQGRNEGSTAGPEEVQSTFSVLLLVSILTLGCKLTVVRGFCLFCSLL